MELRPLARGEFATVQTPDLRDRAAHSGRAMYTHHFLVFDDDDEVAFVSLDLYPVAMKKPFVIYELFVTRECRERGVGTQVLEMIEATAMEKGYRSIILKPKPLDKDITEERLVAWYKKRGFTLGPNNAGFLEKRVS